MIALLVNPAARAGRAATRADAMEAALRMYGPVTRYTTRARGDEATQVQRAISDGASGLVVVGGDGAVHHVVKAMLAESSPIPLAVCAAGTGNDFVKSLGTPSHDAHALAAMVNRGTTRRVDIGVIDGVPFCNAAGLGFDVEVLNRMQRPSRLRGTAAYVLTALRALTGYRGIDLALEGHSSARYLMMVFANGQAFGGAFRIAPDAALDDGLIDCIQIGALAVWQRPFVLGAAAFGRHLNHSSVTATRAAHFTMDFPSPPAFEADGELYHAQSQHIEVTSESSALEVFA
ncbi:MAG: YegS/Rv2252/BmrU family lipid kinase [Gemmatimonadaceae bacterium]|nr:YegS/Rv2252/BmrU family lipid kinase [Gemmatimonadaceae bacterium]